jgi:hypothetical protein
MTTFCIALYESYISTVTGLEGFLNVIDLRCREFDLEGLVGVHKASFAKNDPYFMHRFGA